MKKEATFEETIEIIKEIKAKRVIISHIEEPDELEINLLKKLELKYSDLNIKFAYDTMDIKI